MQTIKLPRGEYQFDPNGQIGRRGGFGAVYSGTAPGFGPLAIKRLHVSAQDAAHRELRLAEDLVERQFENVIPILDAGQDADSDHYFVVMPRADRSLQDAVTQDGPFDDIQAVEALNAVANGLHEARHIVHRDLKPDNVLFHEGRWKIADFGIARFVEDSTSLNTLKDCLTRAYAAPEQWRSERATNSTDLYALGCVGYCLLTGHPPFVGPDFSQQHRYDTPPTLDNHLPQLQSLVSALLRKPPQSRPSVDRVLAIIDGVITAKNEKSSLALEALAAAGAHDAQAVVHREAEQAQVSSIKQTRTQLGETAFEILDSLVEELFRTVESQAPSAHRSQNTGSRRINLGKATLRIDVVSKGQVVPEDAFPGAGWDVIAIAGIKVQQRDPSYEWGASLWYTNLGSGDHFRWHECSYFESPMFRPDARRHNHAPFFLSAEDADKAHAPTMGRHQVAYGPFAIDDEQFLEFRDRWCDLLAQASQGQLRHPSYLPITNWDK